MAKAKWGDEITLKSMFDHGRSELAAALLRHNDGHVMYMKGMEKNSDQENAKGAMSMDDLRAAGEAKESGKEAGKEMDDRNRDRGRPEI